jgi:protein arginine N-methyltransferase 5
MAPSNSASSVQITLLPETVSGYASDEELNVSWDMWDTVRNVCDYNQRLCIGTRWNRSKHEAQIVHIFSVLDLTPPLPVIPGVLARWLAEPVKYLYIPSSTFIGNAKGYPVLPKGTQTFIRDMMTVGVSLCHAIQSPHSFVQLQPTVILAGSGSALHTKGGEAAYSQYVRHLEKTSPAMMAQQTSGTVENFAQGYQDYLQAPLQVGSCVVLLKLDIDWQPRSRSWTICRV